MASNADQQGMSVPVVHAVVHPVVPTARLYNVNNRSLYTGKGGAVKAGAVKSKATRNGAKVKTEDREAKKNKALRRECADLIEYTVFINEKRSR
jgi:hypothetical protein